MPRCSRPSSLRAVFGEEALGDLVGAVELGDFLAHDDDVGVAVEFLGHGVAESFAVGDERHGAKS